MFSWSKFSERPSAEPNLSGDSRTDLTKQRARYQSEADKLRQGIYREMFKLINLDQETQGEEEDDELPEPPKEGCIWTCEVKWPMDGWQPAEALRDPIVPDGSPDKSSGRGVRAGASHWVDGNGQPVRDPKVEDGGWVAIHYDLNSEFQDMIESGWRYGCYFPTMDKLSTQGQHRSGPNTLVRWKGWIRAAEHSVIRNTNGPRERASSEEEEMKTEDDLKKNLRWEMYEKFSAQDLAPGFGFRNLHKTRETEKLGVVLEETGESWKISASESFMEDSHSQERVRQKKLQIIEKAKLKVCRLYFSEQFPDSESCIAFAIRPDYGVQFYNCHAWGQDRRNAMTYGKLQPDRDWTTFRIDVDAARHSKTLYGKVHSRTNFSYSTTVAQVKWFVIKWLH